jgi:hypothetical protein
MRSRSGVGKIQMKAHQRQKRKGKRSINDLRGSLKRKREEKKAPEGFFWKIKLR